MPYDQIIANGYFRAGDAVDGLVPSSLSGLPRQRAVHTTIPTAPRSLAEAGYEGGAGLEAFADAFPAVLCGRKESTLGPIVNIINTALQEVGSPRRLIRFRKRSRGPAVW